MDNRSTRSNKDLTQMSIDSLALPIKNEKQKEFLVEDIENINSDVTQQKIDMNKVDQNLNQQSKFTFGHDSNDQRIFQTDKQHQSLLQLCLRSIQKFDGHGNAEHWLTDIMQKFDSLQLTTSEQNELVPEILTGEAKFWYFKHQDHMPTFGSFFKNFLQYYGSKKLNPETATTSISSSIQMKQSETSDCKEIVMECLRNQMLINNLEKLPKFSGKSKQNVSKWLRETQQTLHTYKLSEDQKLFFISLCLEADARDWFFDNKQSISTWTEFMGKLIKTFESSGKSDSSFNRLRHYEQSINQDVKQYYFEIIKLCKEANPCMDEASKVQYLKDGLKSSLRFDVLLKNPQTPEEFLEYAQKIEELKSLDEKQLIMDSSLEKKFISPSEFNRNQTNQKLQQGIPSGPRVFENHNQTSYNNNYRTNASPQRLAMATSTQGQYSNNDTPKPPYQCFKCGAFDHFIRNCPHFQ